VVACSLHLVLSSLRTINQEAAVKATVDQGTCIGCGLCPDVCPEVFAMDDDDKAYTKVDQIPAGVEEKATEAAQSCPVEAITIA